MYHVKLKCLPFREQANCLSSFGERPNFNQYRESGSCAKAWSYRNLCLLTKRKCWKNFAFLLLKYMMLSVLLILNLLSTLLSLLMYVVSNIHIYLYMYLWPVCTNVNNYVIFVPHVPIYWSEGIYEFEVEKKHVMIV